LPSLNSAYFELCSFDAISKPSLSDTSRDEAVLGYVIAECCAVQPSQESEDPLFSGPGSQLPDIKPVLKTFFDVLVNEVPGGLPPVRFDAAGEPIEHCIDLETSENLLLDRRGLSHRLRMQASCRSKG
jgi:hypothetical protein